MEILNKRNVASQLRRRRCPTHGKAPDVQITRNGFQFTTCCDTHRGRLAKEASTIIAKEAEKGVESELKRLFK